MFVIPTLSIEKFFITLIHHKKTPGYTTLTLVQFYFQFEALEDIEMLNAIMFETYIQSEGFEHSHQDLTSILETMAVFCAHNTDWNGSTLEAEV